MSLYFITGTDTDCGKTTVTSALAHYFTNLNTKVITQKWIQTGFIKGKNDIDDHLKFLNLTDNDSKKHLNDMCPYTFKLASSAHIAASHENKTINIEKLIQATKNLSQSFNTVLIEGLGGICVPINKTQTTLDILRKINTKIIIVIENKLGCINHSLLTYEIIKKNNLNCIGFIMNNKNPDLNSLIAKDNPKIIQSQTNLNFLAEVSHTKKLTIKIPF